MKNRYIIPMIVALAALMFACSKEQKAPTPIPPAPALMTKAECADVNAYIETLGTTAALEDVNIVPQVSGQIVKINFEQGMFVKKGQKLFEIDKRPFEAALLNAEGNLRQAVAQLKIDKLEVERNRKLVKSNYVDRQTFDRYLAKVESDEGAVQSAQAALDTAKINLAWCDVLSPIDGLVGLYNINLGNVVSAGVSVVTTVRNVKKLYIDFVIPSQRLFEAQNLIKKDGKLKIQVTYIESGFDKKYTREAEAKIVLNRIRYETGTAVLRAELENSDSLFWPHQPVSVKLNLAKITNAVLVPNSVINTAAKGEYVYVASPYKGGVFVLKQVFVQLGQLYKNDMREVKGDVKAGDLIVENVSQLRLQAGPFVYRATKQGAVYDANGKVLTKKEEIMKFVAESATYADELRVAGRKQAAEKLKAETSKK